MIDRSERQLVIGTGPAGLVAARWLGELGIPFDLVERQQDVGGIWDIEAPGAPMYQSAHFISSKTLSAFRDRPMLLATRDRGADLKQLPSRAQALGTSLISTALLPSESWKEAIHSSWRSSWWTMWAGSPNLTPRPSRVVTASWIDGTR
jgi:cation diffusion facilitator CzcD-associated flavoprotein CzcO